VNKDSFVKNVLFLINDLDTGGAQGQLKVLAESLSRKGFKVAVVSLYRTDRPNSLFRKTDLPLFCLNMRGRYDFLRARKIIKIIRQQDTDIIHSFLFDSNIWACIYGMFFKKIKVVTTRRSVDVWKGRKHFIAEKILENRFADRVVSNSESGADFAAKNGIIPDKLRVVYNGVNLNRFSPRPKDSDIRKTLRLGADTVVGVVADLKPEKGYGYLIKAAAALRGDYHKIKYVVVGEGKDRAKLTDLVREAGLSEIFIFTGRRDDTERIISVFDIRVLPSAIRVGISNFLLESMAMAKPVIASDVGAIKEIVNDGENGLLVPPRNEFALAGAIKDLIDKPAERERMGKEGRRFAESMTAERMVEETLGIYGEL
jgi:glycosyltransferase involved in cell wall biosynthesis